MQKIKILHQHLIKCGGTSLNAFLDTKYHANKALDDASIGLLKDNSKKLGLVKPKDIHKNIAHYHFKLYDSIHGHNPLFWNKEDDFFTITVLREPVTRVLSQIRDWKRLNVNDFNKDPVENKKFKTFALTASVLEIIENYEKAPVGKNNIPNMQTQLLAKSYLGLDINIQNFSEKDLLEIAKKSLDMYDHIGTTESLDSFTIELCYKMGWCPPQNLHRSNQTKNKLNIDIDTIDRIKGLNKLDQELYNYAKEIIEKNKLNLEYNVDMFEKKFASKRVSILSPIYTFENIFSFDMNMPIIGNGFYPRDAANTSECAVWTSSKHSTLFMPILPYLKVDVMIYIKGVADKKMKNNILLLIDGEDKKVSIIQKKGYDFILTAEHISTRDFLRIDMKTSFITDCKNDKRKRGLSIHKYGYKLK